MRKTYLMLAAAAPLVALAGFALPATAESPDESCVGQTGAAPAGPIDLEAIPTQPVDGSQPLQVQGGGDCDEDHVAGDDDGGGYAELNDDHHEGRGDYDD